MQDRTNFTHSGVTGSLRISVSIVRNCCDVFIDFCRLSAYCAYIILLHNTELPDLSLYRRSLRLNEAELDEFVAVIRIGPHSDRFNAR